MDIKGTITFFYYDNLAKAAEFYRYVMMFEEVIDVEFAKVFKVYGDVHVGLVDGDVGYLKWKKDKPVMLSWFTENIDDWHHHLIRNDIEIEQPPMKQKYLKMKTMLFRDPEGYLLELLEWIKKPYGQ